MENSETQVEETVEQVEDFDVKKYLEENGLLQKWEASGLFEGVTTSPEKYLIASIMEAMLFKSFYMQVNEGKNGQDILKFHDQYMTKMASLGVFNGKLFEEILEKNN